MHLPVTHQHWSIPCLPPPQPVPNNVVAPAKKPLYKRWWFITIAVIFALAVLGKALDGKTSSPTATDTRSTSTPSASSTSEATPEASPTTEATPDVPREHKNALAKAKTYSDTMHMSKQGIYKQLTTEIEGFSPEAAQYAIDNLQADYNANALAKAKTYADTMHMSKQGIYNQLTSEFEGFTDSEADYAVAHLNK